MIKTHRDSFPRLSPAITLAEISEAFCEGHVAAFAFFGGVPRSILSVKEIRGDTKLAVALRQGPPSAQSRHDPLKSRRSGRCFGTSKFIPIHCPALPGVVGALITARHDRVYAMTGRPTIGLTLGSEGPGGYAKQPRYALRENDCAGVRPGRLEARG